VKGRLEEFSPAELIQTLGQLGKNGALRVRIEDPVGEDGLIVFRNGKIIYAASSSVRESLGSLLLARELISEADLEEALERQATSSEKTRLGNVLVQMGVLEQSKLEQLIREQFSTIISEFIHWSAGSFSFEPMEVVDRGEIEMETAEYLVASGLESTHILLDAARRADEERQEAEQDFGAPSVEADSLDTLLEEVTSPSISGETVYRLLDLGSDTCGRCLLFAVYPRHFAVVGHFGLEKSTDFSAKRLSDLQIPRQSPSILARAADKRHPILAKLPTTEEEARILDALGGLSPTKSFAVPLQVEDQVILVFYGDHLPDELSTGQLEELEIVAAKAVRSTGFSAGTLSTEG
jgi:hypothetical protein